MTVNEVAEYLKVHHSPIHRLLRQHQMPAFQVGTDWRFNREQNGEWRLALEAWSYDTSPV